MSCAIPDCNDAGFQAGFCQVHFNSMVLCLDAPDVGPAAVEAKPATPATPTSSASERDVPRPVATSNRNRFTPSRSRTPAASHTPTPSEPLSPRASASSSSRVGAATTLSPQSSSSSTSTARTFKQPFPRVQQSSLSPPPPHARQRSNSFDQGYDHHVLEAESHKELEARRRRKSEGANKEDISEGDDGDDSGWMIDDTPAPVVQRRRSLCGTPLPAVVPKHTRRSSQLDLASDINLEDLHSRPILVDRTSVASLSYEGSDAGDGTLAGFSEEEERLVREDLDRAQITDCLTGYRMQCTEWIKAKMKGESTPKMKPRKDLENVISLGASLKHSSVQALTEFMPMIVCAASETPVFLWDRAQEMMRILGDRAKTSPDVAQALAFLAQAYPERYSALNKMDLASSVIKKKKATSSKHERLLGKDTTSVGRMIVQMYNQMAQEKPGHVWEVPLDITLPHPFLANRTIKRIKVINIFNSKTKPRLLELQHTAQLTAEQQEHGRSGGFVGAAEESMDRIILKVGDDIRQDAACLQIFLLMNVMFHREGVEFNGVQGQALVYGCLPIGPTIGVLECVQSVKPLRKVASHVDNDPASIDRLVASAACSYIATYVLGIRDRHDDNVLVQKDGVCFHIDFGFILNESPALDTSPFAITKSLQGVMGNKWEGFLDLTVKAFSVLRKYHDVLMTYCQLAFAPFGETSKVDTFLRGALMLDLSKAKAEKRLRKMLIAAPGSYRTRAKNIVHRLAVRASKRRDKNHSRQPSMESNRSSYNEGDGHMERVRARLGDQGPGRRESFYGGFSGGSIGGVGSLPGTPQRPLAGNSMGAADLADAAEAANFAQSNATIRRSQSTSVLGSPLTFGGRSILQTARRSPMRLSVSSASSTFVRIGGRQKSHTSVGSVASKVNTPVGQTALTASSISISESPRKPKQEGPELDRLSPLRGTVKSSKTVDTLLL